MASLSPITKSKFLFIIGGIWTGIAVLIGLICCYGLFILGPVVENHLITRHAIQTSDLNNTGIKADASITELYQDDRQCETDVLGGVWFSVCDRGMLEFEANGSKYNATLRVVQSPEYYKYNYNKGDTVEILYDVDNPSRITIQKDKYNLWLRSFNKSIVQPSYDLYNTTFLQNLIISALNFIIGGIMLAFGAKLKRIP